MSGALSLKRMPRHRRRSLDAATRKLADFETLTRFLWAEERGILTTAESKELYKLQKMLTFVSYHRRQRRT